MLESRSLQYFVALAQRLHFGRAAEDLGIAQSALSRQLKQLERALGCQLLERGRRSAVILTASGKALLEESLAGIRQLEQARLAAQRAARGETGRLTVGYVASAAFSGILPRALQQFRTGRPDVEVTLTAMETPAQLNALSEGLLDVGFARSRTAYPAGVAAQVVHREGLLLALSDRHALAHRRIGLKLLSEQTFIIPQFDENTGFAEHVAAFASRGGFEPRRIVRVRDFLTAISLAAGGYGVVPAPASVSCIGLRNIVFRRIQGYAGVAELIVAHRLRASPTALAFLAEVRAVRHAD